MESKEALEKIFELTAQFPKVLKPVLEDMSQILSNPERHYSELGTLLHIKVGENTLWSFKLFLKKAQELAPLHEPATMTEAVEQRARRYMYTGNWHRCDHCGELSLCTADIRTLSCKCVYCKSEEWINRCCDRSEYLNAPIMQAYLNEGVINPLLPWFPEDTFRLDEDSLTESLMMPYKKPTFYPGSDSAFIAKLALEPKPPFDPDTGRFEPDETPHIPLPRVKTPMKLNFLEGLE
jgi:hypothetical protein